jgi:hypothetical protein
MGRRYPVGVGDGESDFEKSLEKRLFWAWHGDCIREPNEWIFRV